MGEHSGDRKSNQIKKSNHVYLLTPPTERVAVAQRDETKPDGFEISHGHQISKQSQYVLRGRVQERPHSTALAVC